MQLPNRAKAYIPPDKLTGYLLSEIHAVGKSKAKFFCALGFDETNIRQHTRLNKGRNDTKMIRELDAVVLARDLEGHPLKAGDVGAVVHCYVDGKTFEVEFVTGEGETVALVTLSEADIRPMCREQVLHVRALVPA